MSKRRSYTDEQFIEAVNNSLSWRQVFEKLGLKVGGGQYTQFKTLASNLNLDLSHMTGQGWNVGDRHRTVKVARPMSEILVEKSTHLNTSSLKKRLWSESILEKKCYRCGSTDWFGQISHLQLEHINGIRNDNRIENLTILCANCHSLTDTYCGKNKGFDK